MNFINQWRKKPVVVDAIQLTPRTYNDCSLFIGVSSRGTNEHRASCLLEIRTLEGTMTASENDYIIKGVNGEFYPCKPDIFEKTYDPA